MKSNQKEKQINNKLEVEEKEERQDTISSRKKQIETISKLNEKHKSTRRRIKFYFFLLILYIIYQYILIPVSFLVEIIFLSYKIAKEDDATSTETIVISNSSPIKIVGWLFIFVLPLFSFILHGIPIISIHSSFISKIWIFFVALLESIIGIPLTFLYENNLYSIFLYQERGFNQTLNPWIVFYPTDFVMSFFEIGKNFIVSAYFLSIGIYSLGMIYNNISQTFIVSTSIFMVILNILRVLALVSILVFKFRSAKKKNDDDDENKIIN
jgi:hypothetical protein